MKEFAALFRRIDRTNSTKAKVTALSEYFLCAGDKDKVWTIALFTHKRPKRTVKTSLLRQWASEVSDIPLWLFEESYHIVGDLAETISLVTESQNDGSTKLLHHWIGEIIELKNQSEECKKAYVLSAWGAMNRDERFLFNKIITGGFRIGVSTKLIVKSIAQATGQEENVISHRLMGNWDPEVMDFDTLILSKSSLDNISKPYPFYLAYAINEPVDKLGDPSEWIAERKWDGIRGQIIIRKNQLFIWTRGEELVTDKFPEFAPLSDEIQEDVVIDGEILAFDNNKPLPFNILQTRIGRKNITKKILQSSPVILVAYDLLEYNGEDIRSYATSKRRDILQKLIQKYQHTGVLKLSEEVRFESWKDVSMERDQSRDHHCEGLMLKRKSAPYLVGRKKGDWWKWKVDPMTIDAVMIYAQRGHGRRANLYTDFSFAVHDDKGNLVTFAKAYSGLTDDEFKEITRWVKKNTIERFGPVSSVTPELVFELAFEGIAISSRHKSGVALRFPRILRWRKDKKVNAINTLEDLRNLL